MSSINQEQIESILAEIQDPDIKQDLKTLQAVKSVDIDGNNVHINIELGYPASGSHAELIDVIKDKLKSQSEVQSVDVSIHTKIVSHSVQKGVKPLPNIKNTIAIASGKGGSRQIHDSD